MIPLVVVLFMVAIANAFTWQNITSGNVPYSSSTLHYMNNPFTAKNDTLYVATQGGLLIRSPNADKMWTVAEGSLSTNNISAVTVSGNGGVWVGCSDGTVSRLYPQTMQGEFLSPFRNDPLVQELQIIREYQGQLLISTNDGISRLKFDTAQNQWFISETYHNFGDLGNNPLIFDMQILNDTIWIGTQKGLGYGAWYDPHLLSPTSWHAVNGTSTSEVYSIAILHDSLYIGGNAGVYRYDQILNMGSVTPDLVSDHYPVYAEFWVGKDTN